jgi:hypothetical protein
MARRFNQQAAHLVGRELRIARQQQCGHAYPAADPDVIGMTATDAEDKLLPQANRGPQVAVAAPGVQVLEPAPDAAYQVATGTSVTAANASARMAAHEIAREGVLDSAADRPSETLAAAAAGGRSWARNPAISGESWRY